MTQSEESITRVTSHRFPHYDGRSFSGTLNDILPLSSPQ